MEIRKKLWNIWLESYQGQTHQGKLKDKNIEQWQIFGMEHSQDEK